VPDESQAREHVERLLKADSRKRGLSHLFIAPEKSLWPCLLNLNSNFERDQRG